MKYIIQSRITATTGKHVCRTCGNNGAFLNVSYEVTTQEQYDLFQKELKGVKDMQEALALLDTSQVSEQVWEATIKEQQEGILQEHGKQFFCWKCQAEVLDLIMAMTGNPLFLMALSLWKQTAIFIIRDVNNPDIPLLVKMDYLDVEKFRKELDEGLMDKIPEVKR
jgi:hypothetical protein